MSCFPNLEPNPLKFDFDTDGPRVGRVALLTVSKGKFRPVDIDTLESMLGKAFATAYDCSPWSGGLDAISRAMNDGDLARAALATVFLPAPRHAGQIMKASPEDPKHPGWPKGSLDGKGGEFRPHDDGTGNLLFETKEQRIERLKSRRQLRAILRRILTSKRIARLMTEAVGDLIPLDFAADALTAADLVSLAHDIGIEVRLSNVAIAFAEQGPRDLESLLVTQDNMAFSSYRDLIKFDLEKQFGPAGEGYQYHHIVEQGPNGSLFAQEQLQSTSNVVRLPTLIHEDVSAIYSTSFDFSTGRMPLREFMRGMPFEQQRAWGLWALQQTGALK